MRRTRGPKPPPPFSGVPLPESRKPAGESGFCGLSGAARSAPAHGRTRLFPGNSCLPPKGGFRFLGFYGLRAARGAPSGFTIRRLAIARGDQFFL
jgi:hypothetical protein